jgi:outer membrane protein
LAASAANARAATLKDCFQNALKQSEVLAESGESILQAEETYHLALGAVLPNLALNYTFLRQDDHAYTPALENQSPASQDLWSVTLSQPLFHGFSEYAALREVKDSLASAKDADRWAAMQVYQDVATAFYTVLSLERNKQLLDDEIKQDYDGRIKELKDFLDIGRARPSDVETVQADQALLQAAEVQVDQQISVEREVLAFLTGQDAAQPLEADDAPLGDAGNLDALIKDAEERPDIHAALMKEKAAEEFVSVNHGAHLPQVDLVGQWYPVARPGSVTPPVDWDASIVATLPLFQGFSLVSKDKQAESMQRQANVELARQRRQAASDIRNAWNTLSGDLAQIQAYDLGFKLADKAYQSLRRDFARGLDTNQDVLLALTQARDAQRSLEAARFAARDAYEQLQTLAGHRLDLFPERDGQGR